MNDSKADFAALLEQSGTNYRRGFDPGEEVIARVVSTKGAYVILDVRAKDEGVVAKEEFIQDDGTLIAEEGQQLQVWFVAMRQGNLIFSVRNKATGRGDATLSQAFGAQTPIDGLVKAEVNGGYEIDVAGQRAFCPYSQMELYRTKEAAEFVGTRQTFLVTEYGEDDRGTNLLVSRRALLERERAVEREKLFAELAEGQTREGVVTRLAEFGVFVDLGGAEGLIPLRELSWQRDVKADTLVKTGDTVEVLVQHVDTETERISLSLRALRQNPWEVFISQYKMGDVLNAKIVRIAPFGAFAQLIPGVDGLLSNGRLAALVKGKRIGTAHEVVTEGQMLEVKIESIDEGERKVSLRPVTAEEPNKERAPENDPEDDPRAWLRSNESKNAAMGNNPFANLSL